MDKSKYNSISKNLNVIRHEILESIKALLNEVQGKEVKIPAMIRPMVYLPSGKNSIDSVCLDEAGYVRFGCVLERPSRDTIRISLHEGDICKMDTDGLLRVYMRLIETLEDFS